MDVRRQNEAVIRVGVEAYLVKTIKPKIVSMLRDVAQRIVDTINGVPPTGTITYPVLTGNMLDATGVAIYDDGATISYLPTKRATKTTHTGLGGGVKDIDGSLCLQDAIVKGQTTYADGLWIVLFSATPYAFHIDEAGSPIGRGQDFFKNLKQEIYDDVVAGLKPIV